MEKINYEKFQDIISYLQSESKNNDEINSFFESNGINNEQIINSFKSLVKGGKKHINALEKILKEDVELSSNDVIEYSGKINKIIECHGFATPLLIKELPEDLIEDFKQPIWAQLTKSELFKKSDYDGKKLVLNLACVFGVFSDDIESLTRMGSLTNLLHGKQASDLSSFKDLEAKYNPQFFRFVRDNINTINSINLKEIQNNWNEISKCVDIKTPENVQKYLDINKEKGGNGFDTYMEYHGVPKGKIAKYEQIYNYMKGRTETSLPTVSGQVEKGFSYEMLDFSDIRVMRFGETVKCCQALGSNAETSMINSAIESTSRAMLVYDEKGKPVAGSFVTHKIDKNGRSYVCFDSIEVNASKLPIKAVKYSKTLKKIEKLVKKGVITSASVEDIEKYFNDNPNQKDISENDIKALKINNKIRDTYKVAIDDMIKEDEDKRKTQLENGEITKEEYEHLLIKNGRVTVGRNPVSMYLGDLPRVEKKDMELLPATTKDKKIYKKAHKISPFSVYKKTARGISKTFKTLGAMMLISGGSYLTAGVVIGSVGTFMGRYFKKQLVDGIYSDATRDQRLLYDGRENLQHQIEDQNLLNDLKEKLVYSKFDEIEIPKKIEDFLPEQRKQYRRFMESIGKNEFAEEDRNSYIIGNGKNWSVSISRENDELIINDVSMLSDFGFTKNKKMLTDSQNQMIKSLQSIVGESNSIRFACKDMKINNYLQKNIKTKRYDNITEIKQIQKQENQLSQEL